LSVRFLARRILQAVRLNSRILEVGAGRSTTAPVLAQAGRGLSSLTLLDKSAAMLEHSAEWRERGVGTIIADARSTSLPSGNYDLVVASLCDPFNQMAFWREVQRILVAGGVCLATLPAYEWARVFREKDGSDSAEFLLTGGHRVAVPSFVPPLDRQLEMFSQAGLLILEVVTFATGDLTGQVSPKLNVPCIGGADVVMRGFAILRN
jgi:SAM-dependent methyltransferase